MLQKLTDRVDDDFDDFEPLKFLAKQAKVPPSYIILPIALLVFLLTLFTTVVAHFMITLLCVVYPAYMTFKVISSNITQTMDQIVYDVQCCKNWLTFWIVFCFLTVFDRLISTLLFFVPGYYALKFVFLVWMIYPKSNGTQIIR